MAQQTDLNLAWAFHWQSSYARPGVAQDYARPGSSLEATGVDLPGRDEMPNVPIGDALRRRHSVRDFALRPLRLAVLGQLLAASYGQHGERVVDRVTIPDRPVPSAGALYPLELYVATQAIEGLADGAYLYSPPAHRLTQTRPGHLHATLAQIALDQSMLRTANLVIVIAARFPRTMVKYGQRGYRYVLFEAGHLAQNLSLVATALGLGATPIGGFYDGELAVALGLMADENPLYMIAAGQPSQN